MLRPDTVSPQRQTIHFGVLFIFIFLSFIFYILSLYLYHLKISAAPIMEDYYQSFRFPSLLKKMLLEDIPPAWPLSNIKSYAYDFSVVYEISRDRNVIEAKALIMPENILPYGPLSFILFSILGFFEPKAALFFYRVSAFLAFCISVSYSVKKNYDLSFIKTLAISVFLIFIPITLNIFVSSGNIEVFLFASTIIALSSIQVNPKQSILFLGLSGAIKYYPSIFLLFFIKDRKFALFTSGIILTALLIFLPFFFLKGGFYPNLHFTLGELLLSSKLCSLNPEIFCTVGSLSIANHFFYPKILIKHRDFLYSLSSAMILISGIASFFSLKSRSMASLALVTTFCLVPQVSAFYKLSYLIIFIILSGRDKLSFTSAILAALIALCLSPIPFYFSFNFIGMKADFSMLLLLMHLIIVVNAVGAICRGSLRIIIKRVYAKIEQ